MRVIICAFAAASLASAACDGGGVGTNQNTNNNAPICGNGVVEGVEDCDLDDLEGLFCADVVPGTTGPLLCTAQCTFNISGCTSAPVCGNGIPESGEECDLTNLGGATCADIIPNSSGTLLCTDQCTFNTAGCSTGAMCGNGIHEFGESCDCGTDPMYLPMGCTDVNGGANANCSATCARIDLCGDGVRSGTEECDCGNASMISAPPTGCSAYNGETGSQCNFDCTTAP